MLTQLRLLRDVAALTLLASTWRLWFAASDFPAVPFVSFLTGVPRSVDQVLSGVLVVSLFAAACISGLRLTRGSLPAGFLRIERCCDLVFLASAASLILLNQHCLQPWMYHFLILAPLLWPRSTEALSPDGATTDPERDDAASLQGAARGQLTRTLILWFTSSIYVWSAWSKLDVSFIQSHGPKFVSAILDAVGVSTQFWSEQTWQLAAAMLPIGELVVGVGLLFRRTRKLALLASLVMHLLLMVAIGPWGLDHRPGVLIWNVFFIVLNAILILNSPSRSVTAGLPASAVQIWNHTAGQAGSGTRERFVLVMTLGVVLFPTLRSIGCCDTWPAWAVYASSPARVLVQVRNDSVDQLPESLRQYIEPRQINDGWSWLRIDLWSLNATDTPIYPEDRFQLAVARSVSQDFKLSDGIRIIHEAQADRWTGKRERTQAIGEAEITELGICFRLNSTPR
jgi:hypothetical protein